MSFWWKSCKKCYLVDLGAILGDFPCGDCTVNCSMWKRNVLWTINVLTSSLIEQVLYGIFMFKEGRGLWILCKMRRWSKSRSWDLNGLLLDIDYSYTSFNYILDDMMLIRSWTTKVGHDLDLKISV